MRHYRGAICRPKNELNQLNKCVRIKLIRPNYAGLAMVAGTTRSGAMPRFDRWVTVTVKVTHVRLCHSYIPFIYRKAFTTELPFGEAPFNDGLDEVPDECSGPGTAGAGWARRSNDPAPCHSGQVGRTADRSSGAQPALKSQQRLL